MTREKLTLITGNMGKVNQVARYLSVPFAHHGLDLTEIQSLDLNEVLEHKVREAYAQLKVPVFVDDTAVTIEAFGKLPGPFIRWFAEGMGYKRICELAQGSAALAQVGIGYFDGRNLKTFIGSIEGTVANEPKGTNGFGWDVFFIPKGYTVTRAQLTGDDYDQTSPRRIALAQAEPFFREVTR